MGHKLQVHAEGLLPVAMSSSSPVFASCCGLPCECLLAVFCFRSVCAVGILFGFLTASHTDMYVVVTNPRGPRIRFHVPPRRHPYSARDISCSLVLRVGSCQLMRIQGLRAVTKIHWQFVVRRVLMRKFIVRVGSHFALSSTKQTWTGTQTTPGIFRSLHAVGSLYSAPSSHADVCRCSHSIEWTPSSLPRSSRGICMCAVVGSCQNVRVRNGSQTIISTLCRFLLYSGLHHTNSGWRRKPFLAQLVL